MQKNYLNVNFLPGWSQSTHENIICEEERVAQHDNNKDKGSPLIYQKRSSHLLTSIAYKYKVFFFAVHIFGLNRLQLSLYDYQAMVKWFFL